MKIAIVRAVSRDGYHGYWAAARRWPSDSPRIIEVLDGEDDPVPLPGQNVNQEAIGQKSLRALEAEGLLSVNLREVDSLADIEIVNNVVQIRQRNKPTESTSGEVAIVEKPSEPKKKHK